MQSFWIILGTALAVAAAGILLAGTPPGGVLTAGTFFVILGCGSVFLARVQVLWEPSP